RQVNYRVPASVATGIAAVTISAGGTSVPGSLNIVSTYPGLFKVGIDGLAAGQVARVVNGQVVYQSATEPVSAGTSAQPSTLVLYGTGLNGAATVTATIGGQSASVAYAGPQGTYPGLDQINVTI